MAVGGKDEIIKLTNWRFSVLEMEIPRYLGENWKFEDSKGWDRTR